MLEAPKNNLSYLNRDQYVDALNTIKLKVFLGALTP